jgi:hypothetical protein
VGVTIATKQAAILSDVKEHPRTVYQQLRMRAMARHPPDLVTPIETLRAAIDAQCMRARDLALQCLHGNAAP